MSIIWTGLVSFTREICHPTERSLDRNQGHLILKQLCSRVIGHLKAKHCLKDSVSLLWPTSHVDKRMSPLFPPMHHRFVVFYNSETEGSDDTANLWTTRRRQISLPIQAVKLVWNWEMEPPHNPEIAGSDSIITPDCRQYQTLRRKEYKIIVIMFCSPDSFTNNSKLLCLRWCWRSFHQDFK